MNFRDRRTQVIAGAVALVIVVAAVGFALAGGHKKSSPTTSAARATTTTVKRATPAQGVIAPLTGQRDATGESVRRPALTIKVENTHAAYPQIGVAQADVVYEEVVESGITRLLAILQLTGTAGRGAGPLGPPHRPERGDADRWDLRVFGRRGVRDPEHPDRAGQARRRDARRRRDVPRLVAHQAAQSVRSSRATVRVRRHTRAAPAAVQVPHCERGAGRRARDGCARRVQWRVGRVVHVQRDLEHLVAPRRQPGCRRGDARGAAQRDRDVRELPGRRRQHRVRGRSRRVGQRHRLHRRPSDRRPMGSPRPFEARARSSPRPARRSRSRPARRGSSSHRSASRSPANRSSRRHHACPAASGGRVRGRPTSSHGG